MKNERNRKFAFYCRIGNKEKDKDKEESLNEEQKLILYRILQSQNSEKKYISKNNNSIEQLMKNEYIKAKEEKRKKLKNQTVYNRLSKKPIYKINGKRNVEPNRKIINKKESR